MQEMIHEIEDIERSTLPKEDSSSTTTSGTIRPKNSKMEDLLQGMQRLSAKHKETVDSSNKEEYECASTTSNSTSFTSILLNTIKRSVNNFLLFSRF